MAGGPNFGNIFCVPCTVLSRGHQHRAPRQYLQCPNAALFFSYVSQVPRYSSCPKPSHNSATVAGDRQVRVFDVGYAHGGSETEYSNARTHLLTCHEDRVKRIVTEESPDVFLTVSEVACVGHNGGSKFDST